MQSCAMCSGLRLFYQGGGIRWPAVVPSNLVHSVILWDAGDYSFQTTLGETGYPDCDINVALPPETWLRVQTESETNPWQEFVSLPVQEPYGWRQLITVSVQSFFAAILSPIASWFSLFRYEKWFIWVTIIKSVVQWKCSLAHHNVQHKTVFIHTFICITSLGNC